MNVLVIGMGLIGGSICKAAKKYTDHVIGGYDLNTQVMKEAKNDKVIDEIVSEKNEFCKYDLIIVCLHPRETKEFIKNNITYLKKDSILMDVCGVKSDIVDEMTTLSLSHSVNFVGTHPMAGREKYGYENSICDLFRNANFIITPVEKTSSKAVKTVQSFAAELGFLNFSMPSPDEHDEIIAYTSQLAHIVSSAYVKSPTMVKEKGFTGGSFQDMTRIATMNEKMWTMLFMNNKNKLVRELDILIENLGKYRTALIEENHPVMEDLIYTGRRLKEKDLGEG